ncbi:MAG: UDP-N-acetylmuramoyl-tripeptide--D-alanyl-D-alanine ligase, partial [Halioglobus sp.]
MMRPWSLSELQTALDGQLTGADCEVLGVCTDTRQALDRSLFVALKGANFDGHGFLSQAQKSGAVAALVSADVNSSLPLLRVADTQRALGKLGAYNREEFTGTLIGITGSSGKTTVKNMLQSVLSQRGNTLATQGNLNNEIGVPLTLLGLDPEHEFAVIEMGAGRQGDIAWLCELGKPSVSLLLNVLPAHLEGFGSVGEIAQAKGEIFDDLKQDGFAIINADQPWADEWRGRAAPASIIDYGLENRAAVWPTSIRSHGVKGVSFTVVTPIGEALLRLQLPGMHNVSNALAAVAAGVACELSMDEIRHGLELVVPVAGRLSVERISSGADVIDDCYNANPGSVRAAIDVLAACQGTRTLVLGAMLELGSESDSMHREIGGYAKDAGVDQLWGVGQEVEVAVAAFG